MSGVEVTEGTAEIGPAARSHFTGALRPLAPGARLINSWLRRSLGSKVDTARLHSLHPTRRASLKGAHRGVNGSLKSTSANLPHCRAKRNDPNGPALGRIGAAFERCRVLADQIALSFRG